MSDGRFMMEDIIMEGDMIYLSLLQQKTNLLYEIQNSKSAIRHQASSIPNLPSAI